MKKVLSLLSVLGLSSTLLFPQLSHANELDQSDQVQKSTESKQIYWDPYTGETITDLYSVTENGLKKITFDEFKAHRKLAQESQAVQNDPSTQLLVNDQTSSTTDSQLNSMAIVTNFYTEGSSAQVYQASYPVTNPYTCAAGAISCSSSISWSKTEGEQFSANVTSDMKKAIKLGASFTWVSSATITSTYTLTIPPGKTGEIRFSPLFNRTTGTMDTYVDGWYTGTSTVSATSPVKLQTGQLAGDVYTRVW